MDPAKYFYTESGKVIQDTLRLEIFDDNISNYDKSVAHAKLQYQNIELARKRAGYIRHKGIDSLEKYLIEFEANFERNGGKIAWAQDSEEALSEILNILKKKKADKVILSKSLIGDEIKLDQLLQKENITGIRINPAEWVLDQTNEKPRHSHSFLIEKSFSQIVESLAVNIKNGYKRHTDQLLEFIAKSNRNEINNANITVSSANFLIADTGSICISENSGDGTLCSSFSGISVILAGIDKVIPSLKNLDTLLPLYSTYSSGDRFHAYNTIIQGPKLDSEKDGPAEVYLILIDNGRSDVLAQKEQRRALSCIDCGACQNACPVYRKTGGKPYNTTITGPIGSVLNPWMHGFEEYIHQSYASTLCGKCTEVCPVNINLHNLLINNRNDSVKLKSHKMNQRAVMEMWHFILKSRSWMDKPSFKWKNRLLKRIYGDKWGSNKVFPEISEKSFKQLWEERREGKLK